MFRVWAVTGALCAVAGAMSVLGVLGTVRCWRRYSEARRLAPLELEEVVGSPPPGRGVPVRWPDPKTMQDQASAAAYRDYARRRGAGAILTGDLIALVAGGALGATLPSLG